MNKLFFFFLSIMALSLLSACGGGGKSPVSQQGDTLDLRYAVNLSIVDYDGYTVVKSRNPWDTTKTLQTYYLVPDTAPMPAGIPTGAVVIRTPLTRTVVYTSVHASLLRDLDALDAIAGVCDAKYILQPALRTRIDEGKVVDCGNSMSPNLEKIIMLKPQALLLSAYENSTDHNKVAQMGIPIVDCADYMETSPLGQAEWMRFYGRLYGRAAEADSLFNETERQYHDIKALAADAESRPAVMMDQMYGSTWGCPAAYSTTGLFIEDAGGSNPFDSYRQSGSVQLSPEEVLYRAHDADIWLLRYAQADDLTLSQLAADNVVYTRFRPYAEGQVYGCNSQYSTFFEDVRFHPQWLLAEMADIIHPELGITYDHKPYFTKLEK